MDEVRVEMERDIRAHPSDDDIALSAHTPLYPPGKIIHIVRSHPSGKRYGIISPISYHGSAYYHIECFVLWWCHQQYINTYMVWRFSWFREVLKDFTSTAIVLIHLKLIHMIKTVIWIDWKKNICGVREILNANVEGKWPSPA